LDILFESGPYGIVSAKTDTDIGFHYEKKPDLNSQHWIVPVGKALNNHCLIFSNKLQETYGKLIPDIFASHCTESVQSFLCAALKLYWIVHKDITVHHEHKVDKQSAGFGPWKWKRETKRETWDHPFIIPSITDRICTPQCWDLGLGYEECRNVMVHRSDVYDKDGFHKIPQIFVKLLKTKLFLQTDEFDYSGVRHTFIE
jgi:hypothetical protein